MTSSESKCARAYANDLHWKMVRQSEVLSLNQETVAINLGVDRSTVSRTVSFFKYKPGAYIPQGVARGASHAANDRCRYCYYLQRSGFTHQKLCLVALQRDSFLRQIYSYSRYISLYKPEMFIFLDETGADQRNAVKCFGYSLRGILLEKESLFER